MAIHDYTARVVWTGNLGAGTESYGGYDRTWNVETAGKPVIQCSNDPLLGGDPTMHNPEDMLVAALSACHMLWFLHLASNAGINVLGYSDDPLVVGESEMSGASRFLRATLRPLIVLAEGSDEAKADAVHSQIHKVCFIARSVNFPVEIDARYRIGA
ncbi:OsmC family protein [Roseovarius pelagicus]|uniref:OsmC family protein n=1 Tax=Roseovarius pelagicus TaxID=2980108 RepID=A0ABY6DAV7_9RHOB|nr:MULTISPECIES: OsmC family protein [Rhodobacterales]UXX83292.1 OsmC family protein [Roseovarius pelagicus]